MNELLVSFENTAGLIKRSVANFKKLGAQNINATNINKRLELLKGYWDEVRSLNVKISLAAKEKEREELPYFKLHQFALIEDAYEEAVSGFLAMLEQLEPIQPLMDESMQHDHGMTGSRPFSLPRLDLPKFTGSYMNWVGEALSLVDNLPITEANYDSAWTALTDRYENRRLIVDSYLDSFINLPIIKSRHAKELRKIIDSTNNALIALKNLQVYNETWDPIIVFIVSSKLDLQTRTEWEFELKNSTEVPKFDTLKSFLTATLRALEFSAGQKSSSPTPFGKPSKSTAHALRSHQTNVYVARCILCQGNHRLYQCTKFKERPIHQRLNFIKANSCMNCLSTGHFSSQCNSANVCGYCKKRHHSLLHRSENKENPPTTQDKSSNTSNAGNPYNIQSSSDVNTHSSVYSSSAHTSRIKSVLLPTAMILIKTKNGRFAKIRALLDQGSQASFISERIVTTLRLNKERVDARVSVVGGSRTNDIRIAVSCAIEPIHGQGPTIDIRALMLPKLTSYIPEALEMNPTWTHLKGLQFADPSPHEIGLIDLIIGSDYLGQVFLNGLRKGDANAPAAVNTIFGWVIFGNHAPPASDLACTLVINHICLCRELNQSLAKFWNLDDIPEISGFTEEETRCENHFVSTHSRTEAGRYVVRLPFKSDDQIYLPNSAEIARMIYTRSESRLLENSEQFKLYQEFMREYLSLGHMQKVTDTNTSNSSNYLSHHSVWKETSSTTKLRVVFNASMKTSNGKSLNDYLLIGPKLQKDLSSLICSWRSLRFVYCADIEKMFRQILVDDRDIDFQRIFWRSDKGSSIESFQLRTVTYGTACAPYLANRVIRQLALDEAQRFPDASAILLDRVYVDDVMFGADDLESAVYLRSQLSDLVMAGGFRLRKWASNSAELLKDLDEENHNLARDKILQEDENLKILGVTWNPSSDSFYIQISLPEISSFTKRSFLSCMLRNFDPLGWVAAVTIQAKILLQILWTRKLEWDDILPKELNLQCSNYYKRLSHLRSISIPRWTGQCAATERIAIHGFADASNTAYAAVIYMAIITPSNEIKISFLVAKTKVAPLKVVSIPRLELCAAHLLAKLVNFVHTSMNLHDVPTWCWSDSSVTLTWIRSSPAKWKTFVANRVSDIHSKIPNAIWRYTPSKENPADLASRGFDADRLVSCSLWWQGPHWLQLSSQGWPAELSSQPSKALKEQRSVQVLLIVTSEEMWYPFKPVSTWYKLLRITCYCLRFIQSTQKKVSTDVDISITSTEIHEAATFWIKRIQNLFFTTELRNLKRKEPISLKSNLLKLNPILDERGIIRVGGRLKWSSLSFSEKFPIILPKCELTELIVHGIHRRTLHGGLHLMLQTLRLKYWIIGARVVIKRCISNCVTCVRHRALPATQLMGSLPDFRINQSRPFAHVGVDLAGPFFIRISKGRGQRSYKTYIVLFVCLVVRAVHLELVDSFSTADFLAAFERFVARRGLPSDIYSDNGTNFHGADKELVNSYKIVIKSPELRDYAAKGSIKWHFIPPGAPHFGGMWESGVKSVKYHLRRVIGATTPTKEEFSTILCKVEACLNSRPIAPLNDEIDSLEALTPGHFLIGSSLMSIPGPSLLDVCDNRLTRWQMTQKISEQFWKLWSTDYLNSLQQRSRWYLEKKNLTENDLVLLRNTNIPPAKWELARVLKCHPGSDGLVRVVTLRTASGVYKRPIVKICLLPVKLNEFKETVKGH